ncbi:MAG TPA: hypothetical protein VFK07_00375, partial [Candidatus Paceibacterota bacterium]|nr:hypothetical protein [Candidatus Paceibacterota bacterium]
ANLDQSSNHTCNGANACGWVQFTPGTYKDIAKTYPAAKLIPDFNAGAVDHLNSMEAAILLYDQNLHVFLNQNGPSTINDPKLEEYLAAAYNGGSVRVNNTIEAAVASAVDDWVDALTTKKGGLFPETETYLLKLRYLQDHNLP